MGYLHLPRVMHMVTFSMCFMLAQRPVVVYHFRAEWILSGAMLAVRDSYYQQQIWFCSVLDFKWNA